MRICNTANADSISFGKIDRLGSKEVVLKLLKFLSSVVETPA